MQAKQFDTAAAQSGNRSAASEQVQSAGQQRTAGSSDPQPSAARSKSVADQASTDKPPSADNRTPSSGDKVPTSVDQKPPVEKSTRNTSDTTAPGGKAAGRRDGDQSSSSTSRRAGSDGDDGAPSGSRKAGAEGSASTAARKAGGNGDDGAPSGSRKAGADGGASTAARKAGGDGADGGAATSRKAGGGGDDGAPTTSRKSGGAGDEGSSAAPRKAGGDGDGDASSSASTRSAGGDGDASSSASTRSAGGDGDASPSASARKAGGGGDDGASTTPRKPGDDAAATGGSKSDKPSGLLADMKAAVFEPRWRDIDPLLLGPAWPGGKSFLRQVLGFQQTAALLGEWFKSNKSPHEGREPFRHPEPGINDLKLRSEFGQKKPPSAGKDGGDTAKPDDRGVDKWGSRGLYRLTEKERAEHRFVVSEDGKWTRDPAPGNKPKGDDADGSSAKTKPTTESDDSSKSTSSKSKTDSDDSSKSKQAQGKPGKNVVGEDGPTVIELPRRGPLLNRWADNHAPVMRTVVGDHQGRWYISELPHEAFHNAGVYVAFKAHFVDGRMTAVGDWAGAYRPEPARIKAALGDLYKGLDHFDQRGRKYTTEEQNSWKPAPEKTPPKTKPAAEGDDSSGKAPRDSDSESKRSKDEPEVTRPPLSDGLQWGKVDGLGDDPRVLTKVEYGSADVSEIKVVVLGDSAAAHYIWRRPDGAGDATENGGWRRADSDEPLDRSVEDILSDPRLTEIRVPRDAKVELADPPVRKTPADGDEPFPFRDTDPDLFGGRRESGEVMDFEGRPPRNFEEEGKQLVADYRPQDWRGHTLDDLREALAGSKFHSSTDPKEIAEYHRAVTATMEVIRRGTEGLDDHGRLIPGKTLRWTQTMAAMAMRHGPINMDAGEGKTLAFLADAILHAAAGESLQVFTTRDVLANEAFTLYERVLGPYGFHVGRMDPDGAGYRPAEDGKPTIYIGTLNDAGFGHLRGKVAPGRMAVLDEIDEALVHADTTWILSDGAALPASRDIAESVVRAKEFLDRHVDSGALTPDLFGRKDNQVGGPAKLTEAGVAEVTKLLRAEGRPADSLETELQRINAAATARWEFVEKDNYIIDRTNGKVYIIDQTTHKVMFDPRTSTESRWNGGLAQAVEAKHGLAIRADSATSSSISAKEMFSSTNYDAVTGASGTAKGVAGELTSQFGMPDVVKVPRFQESKLVTLDAAVALDQAAKHRMIADDIARTHGPDARPQLVITNRNSEAEQVSALLTSAKVEHTLIDAQWFLDNGVHAEARLQKILDEAGQLGKVLVINRQGGRGVDIPVSKAVSEAGGLEVRISGKSHLRDIDIQAENRAARTGQEGSVKYYLAADDGLFAQSTEHAVTVIRFTNAVEVHESAQAKYQDAEAAHALAEGHRGDRSTLDAARDDLDAARSARDAAQAEYRAAKAELLELASTLQVRNAAHLTNHNVAGLDTSLAGLEQSTPSGAFVPTNEMPPPASTDAANESVRPVNDEVTGDELTHLFREQSNTDALDSLTGAELTALFDDAVESAGHAPDRSADSPPVDVAPAMPVAMGPYPNASVLVSDVNGHLVPLDATASLRVLPSDEHGGVRVELPDNSAVVFSNDMGALAFQQETQPDGSVLVRPNGTGLFVTDTAGNARNLVPAGTATAPVMVRPDPMNPARMNIYAGPAGWLSIDPGRLATKVRRATGPLYGGVDEMPAPTDVRQGGAATCYLLSNLIGLAARNPGLIKDMITTSEVDGKRLFTVRFFDPEKQSWAPVTVDDSFYTDAAGAMKYAVNDPAQPLWPAVIEKAFAVFRGGHEGYRGIDLGSSGRTGALVRPPEMPGGGGRSQPTRTVDESMFAHPFELDRDTLARAVGKPGFVRMVLDWEHRFFATGAGKGSVAWARREFRSFLNEELRVETARVGAVADQQRLTPSDLATMDRAELAALFGDHSADAVREVLANWTGADDRAAFLTYLGKQWEDSGDALQRQLDAWESDTRLTDTTIAVWLAERIDRLIDHGDTVALNTKRRFTADYDNTALQPQHSYAVIGVQRAGAAQTSPTAVVLADPYNGGESIRVPLAELNQFVMISSAGAGALAAFGSVATSSDEAGARPQVAELFGLPRGSRQTEASDSAQFSLPEVRLSDPPSRELGKRIATIAAAIKQIPLRNTAARTELRGQQQELKAQLAAYFAELPEGQQQVAVARAEQLGSIDWHEQDLAEKLGITLDELHARMKSELAAAFAGKDIAVRVSEETLADVLRDGRFKTAFEVGETGEGVNSRAMLEDCWYGHDQNSHPVEKRAIYGYVRMDTERPAQFKATDYLSNYGDVQVILKTAVRARTTACVGDSIADQRHTYPSPLDNPLRESFGIYPEPKAPQLPRQHVGLGRNLAHPDFAKWRYVEAQVHGGVRVADIDHVILPEHPSQALQEQLRDAGIPWQVFASAAEEPVIPAEFADFFRSRTAAPIPATDSAEVAEESVMTPAGPPTDEQWGSVYVQFAEFLDADDNPSRGLPGPRVQPVGSLPISDNDESLTWDTPDPIARFNFGRRYSVGSVYSVQSVDSVDSVQSTDSATFAQSGYSQPEAPDIFDEMTGEELPALFPDAVVPAAERAAFELAAVRVPNGSESTPPDGGKPTMPFTLGRVPGLAAGLLVSDDKHVLRYVGSSDSLLVRPQRVSEHDRVPNNVITVQLPDGAQTEIEKVLLEAAFREEKQADGSVVLRPAGTGVFVVGKTGTAIRRTGPQFHVMADMSRDGRMQLYVVGGAGVGVVGAPGASGWFQVDPGHLEVRALRASGPLYGSSGVPMMGDVRQGKLGDCYLMANLIGLAASQPNLLMDMIQPSKSHEGRLFDVRFFDPAANNWVWVQVDDTFYADATGRMLYAVHDPSQPLWPAVIEKAWVAFRTSSQGYPGIGEGGWKGQAGETLRPPVTPGSAGRLQPGRAVDVNLFDHPFHLDRDTAANLVGSQGFARMVLSWESQFLGPSRGTFESRYGKDEFKDFLARKVSAAIDRVRKVLSDPSRPAPTDLAAMDRTDLTARLGGAGVVDAALEVVKLWEHTDNASDPATFLVYLSRRWMALSDGLQQQLDFWKSDAKLPDTAVSGGKAKPPVLAVWLAERIERLIVHGDTVMLGTKTEVTSAYQPTTRLVPKHAYTVSGVVRAGGRRESPTAVLVVNPHNGGVEHLIPLNELNQFSTIGSVGSGTLSAFGSTQVVAPAAVGAQPTARDLFGRSGPSRQHGAPDLPPVAELGRPTVSVHSVAGQQARSGWGDGAVFRGGADAAVVAGALSTTVEGVPAPEGGLWKAMPGDGNCLFHALAAVLGMKGADAHDDLRAAVVEGLNTRAADEWAEFFGEFMPGEPEALRHKEFERQLANLLTDSEFMDPAAELFMPFVVRELGLNVDIAYPGGVLRPLRHGPGLPVHTLLRATGDGAGHYHVAVDDNSAALGLPDIGHVDADGVRRFDTNADGAAYASRYLAGMKDFQGAGWFTLRQAVHAYERETWTNLIVRNSVIADAHEVEIGAYVDQLRQAAHIVEVLKGEDHYDLPTVAELEEDRARLVAAGATAENSEQLKLVEKILSDASREARLVELGQQDELFYSLLDYFGPTEELISETVLAQVNLLDQATGQSLRLHEPVQVVRIVGDINFMVGPQGRRLGNGDPRELIGTVQIEPGYLSTSVGATTIVSPPGGYRLELTVRPGANGMYIGKYSVAPGGDQQELLLPRGTRYRITDVRIAANGGTILAAEVLPPHGATLDNQEVNAQPYRAGGASQSTVRARAGRSGPARQQGATDLPSVAASGHAADVPVEAVAGQQTGTGRRRTRDVVGDLAGRLSQTLRRRRPATNPTATLPAGWWRRRSGRTSEFLRDLGRNAAVPASNPSVAESRVPTPVNDLSQSRSEQVDAAPINDRADEAAVTGTLDPVVEGVSAPDGGVWKSMPGDGNCLFHALAAVLGMKGADAHDDLRAEVVAGLNARADKDWDASFREFMVGEPEDLRKQEFARQSANLLSDREFMDPAAELLLPFMVRELGLNVNVAYPGGVTNGLRHGPGLPVYTLLRANGEGAGHYHVAVGNDGAVLALSDVGHVGADGVRRFRNNDDGAAYASRYLTRMRDFRGATGMGLRRAVHAYEQSAVANSIVRSIAGVADKLADEIEDYVEQRKRAARIVEVLKGEDDSVPSLDELAQELSAAERASADRSERLNYIDEIVNSTSGAARLAELLEQEETFYDLLHYFGTTNRLVANSVLTQITLLDRATGQSLRLPEPIQVVRIVGDIEFMVDPQGLPWADRDPTELIDTVQTEPGYLSTSVGAETIHSVAKGYLLKLTVRPGANGLYIGRDGVAFGGDQQELLLPRGTRYRITGVAVNSTGSLTTLTAEVLPPRSAPADNHEATALPYRAGGQGHSTEHQNRTVASANGSPATERVVGSVRGLAPRLRQRPRAEEAVVSGSPSQTAAPELDVAADVRLRGGGVDESISAATDLVAGAQVRAEIAGIRAPGADGVWESQPGVGNCLWEALARAAGIDGADQNAHRDFRDGVVRMMLARPDAYMGGFMASEPAAEQRRSAFVTQLTELLEEGTWNSDAADYLLRSAAAALELNLDVFDSNGGVTHLHFGPSGQQLNTFMLNRGDGAAHYWVAVDRSGGAVVDTVDFPHLPSELSSWSGRSTRAGMNVPGGQALPQHAADEGSAQLHAEPDLSVPSTLNEARVSTEDFLDLSDDLMSLFVSESTGPAVEFDAAAVAVPVASTDTTPAGSADTPPLGMPVQMPAARLRLGDDHLIVNDADGRLIAVALNSTLPELATSTVNGVPIREIRKADGSTARIPVAVMDESFEYVPAQQGWRPRASGMVCIDSAGAVVRWRGTAVAFQVNSQQPQWIDLLREDGGWLPVSAPGGWLIRTGTATGPLYLEGGPRPDDVQQGRIGDCYLLSNLIGLADRNPALIRDMIREDVTTQPRTFSVRFYDPANNSWVWIKVDDTFYQSPTGEMIYATHDGARPLWPAVIEKAWAVFYGAQRGYVGLDGGMSGTAAGHLRPPVMPGSGGRSQLTRSAETALPIFSFGADQDTLTSMVDQNSGLARMIASRVSRAASAEILLMELETTAWDVSLLVEAAGLRPSDLLTMDLDGLVAVVDDEHVAAALEAVLSRWTFAGGTDEFDAFAKFLNDQWAASTDLLHTLLAEWESGVELTDTTEAAWIAERIDYLLQRRDTVGLRGSRNAGALLPSGVSLAPDHSYSVIRVDRADEPSGRLGAPTAVVLRDPHGGPEISVPLHRLNQFDMIGSAGPGTRVIYGPNTDVETANTAAPLALAHAEPVRTVEPEFAGQAQALPATQSDVSRWDRTLVGGSASVRTIGLAHEKIHVPKDQNPEAVVPEMLGIMDRFATEYGVNIDSLAGAGAVIATHPKASTATLGKVKPRPWNPAEIEGLLAALEHYAPIMGAARATSSRAAFDQEVTSVGAVSRAIAGTKPLLSATGEYIAAYRTCTIYPMALVGKIFGGGAREVEATAAHELSHGLLEYALPEYTGKFGSWDAQGNPVLADGAEPPLEEAKSAKDDFQASIKAHLLKVAGFAAVAPKHAAAMVHLQAEYPEIFRKKGNELSGQAAIRITKELEAKLPYFNEAVGAWTADSRINFAGEPPITAYGGTNASEDLAEAAMMYFLDRDRLRTQAPQRFRFLDDLVGKWRPAAPSGAGVNQAALSGHDFAEDSAAQAPPVDHRSAVDFFDPSAFGR
ncbi:C2 family cysteine protease [Nocardia sp. NPDC052316]|uniref:C2 family cysteine protease n=1 Tax=Nocardia sp. NPDC052316 TaxID=3364329 RepID=UPI0037C73DA9